MIESVEKNDEIIPVIGDEKADKVLDDKDLDKSDEKGLSVKVEKSKDKNSKVSNNKKGSKESKASKELKLVKEDVNEGKSKMEIKTDDKDMKDRDIKDRDIKESNMKDSKSVEKSEEKTLYDLPGVGAATAEKLKEVGYTDLMSVAVASPGELTDAAGITESAARKMINAARDSLEMGFESGKALLEKRNNIKKISTGSEGFDQLMEGGFESGSITECFGEFGSGKTQIGHILSVNVQFQDPDAVSVYIDTENTFRPERIVQLAKGKGLDPENVLNNIKVARAYNSDHQMLLAEKVEDLVKNQGLKVKILIVDSLTAHFRAEFVGRGTLAERQQKLNKHMHTLLKIADQYNICVYVTNQVMAKPDMFFGDPTQSIGGHIVGHASTFRIYLRKGKKGSRVAKLIDAPNLADGEATFFVEEQGLRDN